MGFIDQATKQENFMALCDKARKLSSMAKLKDCKKLYTEKNVILARVIETWPSKVELINDEGAYWHIFLEGFGGIHVEFDALRENAKRMLIFKQVDNFQSEQIAV